MDWQGLYQILQPYIAGRIRHLLVAAAAVLVTKHIIQGDQVSAFVDIGMSVVAYLGAEVWSVMAAKTVPWLEAEKKRLEGLLGQRQQQKVQEAMRAYQSATQAQKAIPMPPPASGAKP